MEIQTRSQTKWSEHEQKESIEDPSQFPFLEVESTLPLPQRACCRMLIACDSRYLLFVTMNFFRKIFAKCNKLFCGLVNWSHFIHTIGWIGIGLDIAK